MYGYDKTTRNLGEYNNKGWAINIGKWFGYNNDLSKKLRNWYNENFQDAGLSDNMRNYLNSLDDDVLADLLQQAGDKHTYSVLGNEAHDLIYADVLKALQDLDNNYVSPPKLEDYLGNYYQDAVDAINKENQEVLGLYDDNLRRQTANYQNELDNINNMYNTYAKQVLANDYQKNAGIMGTYQSEMSKARQNSLEAGANAGLRIAGNINTLLSAQNKQASTSLETSNQLAQAMLNQRNAAAGIRSNYNTMLNTDTSNRANLKKGTYERIGNAADLNYNSRYRQYQTAQDIATEQNGNLTENPFYDSYQKYIKSNRSQNVNNF